MNSKDYVCISCKKNFNVQDGCLRRRHFRSGEPICKTCYRKISKGGRYLSDFYPIEIKNILHEKIWEYDTVSPFFDKLRYCKKKVRFVCQECKKEDIVSINCLGHRKICKYKPICRKCALKFAISSDEWKENNSKAQYIAQNRPEVLEKQRKAQFRLMSKDPLYAEKRCSKSFISGTIRGIRFDSSWELYFIVHCWESKDILSIDRYDGNIRYVDFNGKKRFYYPDFIIVYNSGKKKIIEIKGSRKYNNFHEKFNAARKKHGFNYVVYEEKDLLSMGINFRSDRYLRNFYKKYNKFIKFYDNAKTKFLKKRIKLWLK